MTKLNFSLLTTALIACGYSNFATASSEATAKKWLAENQKAEQVEQSYYEDSEDFAGVSSAQDRGWGWNNGIKNALVECTTDCTTATTECTSSCTESSSSETLTLIDTNAADDVSPFNTTVETHISWAIVRDFNDRVIG